MANHPTISVIVPVYNAESTLARCVDSLLGQTFTDFEVILVDDGSRDASPVLCDKYPPRDPRVRVFHKENSGVSSARNLGLDHARGEWIAFVDSDDYVDKRALQILSKHKDFDIIVGGVCFLECRKIYKPQVSGKLHSIDFESQVCTPFFVTVWGKLFRRNIFKDIRFNESLHFAEDTNYILTCMSRSNNIFLISDSIYIYDDSAVPGKYAISSADFHQVNSFFEHVIQACEVKWQVRMETLRSYIRKYLTARWIYNILRIRSYDGFKKELDCMKEKDLLPDSRKKMVFLKCVFKFRGLSYIFLRCSKK